MQTSQNVLLDPRERSGSLPSDNGTQAGRAADRTNFLSALLGLIGAE